MQKTRKTYMKLFKSFDIIFSRQLFVFLVCKKTFHGTFPVVWCHNKIPKFLIHYSNYSWAHTYTYFSHTFTIYGKINSKWSKFNSFFSSPNELNISTWNFKSWMTLVFRFRNNWCRSNKIRTMEFLHITVYTCFLVVRTLFSN